MFKLNKTYSHRRQRTPLQTVHQQTSSLSTVYHHLWITGELFSTSWSLLHHKHKLAKCIFFMVDRMWTVTLMWIVMASLEILFKPNREKQSLESLRRNWRQHQQAISLAWSSDVDVIPLSTLALMIIPHVQSQATLSLWISEDDLFLSLTPPLQEEHSANWRHFCGHKQITSKVLLIKLPFKPTGEGSALSN